MNLKALIIEKKDNKKEVLRITRELKNHYTDLDYICISSPEELSDAPWSENLDIIISGPGLKEEQIHNALEIIKEYLIDIPLFVVGDFKVETAVDFIISGASDIIPTTNLNRLISGINRHINIRQDSGIEITSYSQADSSALHVMEPQPDMNVIMDGNGSNNTKTNLYKKIKKLEREITRLKESETYLIDSQEKYSGLVELVVEGIWISSPEGIITYVNKTLSDMLGYNQIEMIGRHISDFIDEKATEIRRKYSDNKKDELDSKSMHKCLRKDGTMFWAVITLYPAYDKKGDIISISGLINDITELKEAKFERSCMMEELEKERNLLEIILNYTNSAVCLLSGPEFRVEMVNPVYKMIAPGKDMIGKLFIDVWPEIFPSIKPILENVMQTGEPFYKEDDRFMIRRTPDGELEEAYFTWSLIRIKMPGMDNWGIFNNAIETTKRKLAEDKLLEAKKEAERRAREAEDGKRILETLMDYVPEGITIAEAPDARIRMVSRYGETVLGGEHAGMTPEEVANQWTVYDKDGITPMSDQDLPLIRAINNGETIRNQEVVQKNARGLMLPLLCNAAPIRDVNNNIIGGVVAWRDISDLKIADAKLKESEERYRTLFNEMTEGFALHELVFDENNKPYDYRFLEINPAFERLTGLNRDEVIGRMKNEVLQDDDPVWLERYAEVATSGVSQYFDNYSPALKRYYSVFAYRTEPGRFAVLFTDITERKKAEEEIQAIAKFPSENPNPVMRVDSNGLLMYFNEASHELVELWNCVIGHPLPDRIKSFVISTIKEGKQKSIEIECWESIYSIIVVPIAEHGYINLYGRNITSLKHVEKLLRESEERFRLALKYSPVSVYTQDKDLRYTWIYQSTFDKPTEEFIGRTDEEIFITEDVEKINEIKRSVLISGKARHDKVSITVNDNDYYFDMSVEPVFDKEGNISGIACANIDITEMVHLEAEKSKQEVANLIEKTARLASVGVIAGGITHEINQPLNAIRMGAGGILLWNKRSSNVLPGIVVEMLTGINDAVLRIDAIIKSMRALWADNGRDELTIVNVNEIIEKIVRFNAQKLLNHGISLHKDLQDDKLLIRVNELRTELVISNLITNAMHALDQVQTKHKSLNIKTYMDKEYVYVLVEDNGPGLPDIPEDRLYDPFFTTKGPELGSGLGLAIVKMFLSKYDATIRGYNKESGGAAFKIRFHLVNTKTIPSNE